MTDYSTLTTDQLIDALLDDANIFTSRREIADELRARVRELENKIAILEEEDRNIKWSG